mmetsp:Transcript_10563/g.17271  ORF Transcript_10563/g.17271 Transcript_10563/m.17271 type:complete len:386 (-) Transcript_10563:644-1801(-)
MGGLDHVLLCDVRDGSPVYACPMSSAIKGLSASWWCSSFDNRDAEEHGFVTYDRDRRLIWTVWPKEACWHPGEEWTLMEGLCCSVSLAPPSSFEGNMASLSAATMTDPSLIDFIDLEVRWRRWVDQLSQDSIFEGKETESSGSLDVCSRVQVPFLSRSIFREIDSNTNITFGVGRSFLAIGARGVLHVYDRASDTWKARVLRRTTPARLVICEGRKAGSRSALVLFSPLCRLLCVLDIHTLKPLTHSLPDHDNKAFPSYSSQGWSAEPCYDSDEPSWVHAVPTSPTSLSVTKYSVLPDAKSGQCTLTHCTSEVLGIPVNTVDLCLATIKALVFRPSIQRSEDNVSENSLWWLCFLGSNTLYPFRVSAKPSLHEVFEQLRLWGSVT